MELIQLDIEEEKSNEHEDIAMNLSKQNRQKKN